MSSSLYYLMHSMTYMRQARPLLDKRCSTGMLNTSRSLDVTCPPYIVGRQEAAALLNHLHAGYDLGAA